MHYCLECHDIVLFKTDAQGPLGCAKSHPKKVVEVPEEEVKDAIKRRVWELVYTGRVK